MRLSPVRILAVLLVAATFASCDSSTGPVDPTAPQRISLEQVVNVELTADDTVRRYSFVASVAGPYGAFVQAVEGQSLIAIKDSVTQGVRTSLLVTPGAGDLYSRATGVFEATLGKTHIVEVQALPIGSAARFRFQAHRVNPDPEHVLDSHFPIGDTVGTESIDDILDLDDFTTGGNAGQEILIALQATGSPGTEGVILSVRDPQLSILANASSAPGQAPRLSGRFRLPTTTGYFVRVQSIYGVLGRYVGPYRFWSYLIDRAPEVRPASVTVGEEIAGETIARAGDYDEFTFNPPAQTEFNVFLQSSAPSIIRLEALDTLGSELGLVEGVPSDTGLFTHATGRFPRPLTGSIRLRVQAASDDAVADTGSYRFYVYPINRLPEHGPAALVPGDTVSESIDLAGDVDEFTFSGNAGDEFNVVFQGMPPADGTVFVNVVNSIELGIASTLRTPSDTLLSENATGGFTLPATGTYRIRVEGSGAGGRTPEDTGPYRLFFYRINRQPESVPATLALGDSLTEALDMPGDIDEFRVTVPDSMGANLVVELESPTIGNGFLTAQFFDSTNYVRGSTVVATTEVRAATGRMGLRAGTYTVRIASGLPQPTLRGSYRLWLYGFSLGPETVSDTFAIGDTVSGEAIAPWGDADLFHFFGVRGQHVNFAFQGLAQSSSAFFGGSLGRPGTLGEPPNVSVVSPTAAAALEDHQTLRIDLPVTGWYDVLISGGLGVDAQGSYRFAVTLADTLPEHVSASLAPGDSVKVEPIDSPGDWDQFAVTATPGQDLGIVFDGHDGTAGPFLYVRARDASTGDSLAGTVGQFQRFTGPFVVPSGGVVNISVFEPAGFYRSCSTATCNGVFDYLGSYGFRVVPVNRAPESVPATYTVGDTVRGETIATIGDFDEFTATSVPGERDTAYFRLTAPGVGPSPYPGLTLEVIDPATGDTLVGTGQVILAQAFWLVGTFTVPASGNFLIRIRGTGFNGEDITTAPYEFFIKR